MSQVAENRFEVGDLVRVIATDSLLLGLEGRIVQTDFGAGANPYKFESACGEHRCWVSAYQLRKLLPSSVEGEPYVAGKALLLRSNWNAEKGCFEESIVQPPADHIPDATKMVNTSETSNSSMPDPGEGYRLLSKDPPEPLRQGVDFWDPVGKKWKRSYVADQGAKYQRCEFYYRCKIDPANPPEIPDSSSGNPSETPNSSQPAQWMPKVGEFVVRPCGRPAKVISIDSMGGHLIYGCEGTNSRFTLGTLKPWVPKVGDKVRAAEYERVLCGNTGVIKHTSNCMAWILSKNGGHAGWLRFEDLELIDAAAPADHIADANKMVNTPETPDSSSAKRPVVYIAGPMRGISHFNFPAFDAAKAYLIGLGYDVLSPADFDRELDGFDPYKAEYETAEGCADFPQAMDFKRVVTRDLTAVTQCDAIALLPGWENSKGAVAEIAVAHWMGKPVMHLLCDAYRPNEVVYIVNNASTTLEQFVLQLAHAHDAHNKAINCAIDPPPPKQDPDCDILDVAASITRGDRQAGYGPPDQDFKKTADMWTGMFQYMLAPGAAFEPRHVAMAMICIKLSREFHQRKRDNWIDIAGYARCGSLCSS